MPLSVHEMRRMRTINVIIRVLLASLLLMWLFARPAQAAGKPYALGYEVIGQAEKVLKRAAVNSPKWHSKQDSIQRDVYDITFFLEQAVKAAERANEVAMKDNAHQALTLLQRAVKQGHFDPAQIEPVLRLIRQFLPNVSV